ncbi:hypothetical protein AB9K24_08215 [Meridianimaribacter flavus]
MKKALTLLEANELMRHIILFKLYVESEGSAMQHCNIQKSIEELYASDFNKELFFVNKRYLNVNKNYIDRNASFLTYEGLDYFEQWLKSFEKLSSEEVLLLEKELPKPIFDFFKFSKETTTVLSFVNQILKLADRF